MTEMMNIQFMTAEANGVPTGEKDWAGRPRCKYIPNFDAMALAATCEEELEAIESAREMTDKFGGFSFEIVFTAKALHVDFHTGEHSIIWQVLQHPWYEENGVKWSRERMLAEVEETIKGFA